MGSVRITASAIALVVAIAMGTGCGSSPKPLTRVQLVERANAVCRRVATRIETVNKGKSVSTPEQIARLTSKLAGVEQSALAELSRLTPPPALETDWKRFLAGAQSLAEDTATISEAATTNNTTATKRALTSAEATQKQMAAIAKRNGIKACEKVA